MIKNRVRKVKMTELKTVQLLLFEQKLKQGAAIGVTVEVLPSTG